MNKKIFRFSTVDVVEISGLVALAVVLDTFVKFSIGSSGGSLNIATLPLFIIALRHGPFKALIAGGFLFGLITCLIDGYGFQTYPLEYLLPFGFPAILGFFSPYIYINYGKNKRGTILSYVIIVLVLVVWFVVRVLGATVDSMLFWEYEFGPAIIYNLTYCLPSMVAVLILLGIGLMTINHLNHIMPSSYLMGYSK